MTDASAVELVVLALVGLVAGWINTVAGAGSLLLLPALIFTGLDASAANATNRLGILATTIAAVVGYRRAGLSVGRNELVLTGAAMVGGGIGSFIATLLAPEQMQIAIVVAMGVMLVLSLIPTKKKPVEGEAPPAAAKLPAPTAGMIAAFVAIGTYGGFLQAGVGIVALLYLSIAHGVSLVASNVVKSTVTLALTVIAIAVFAARGETIDVVRGGVLAVTSAIGGLVGARATVALGDRFVRVTVVIAVVASMIKLVHDMI
ncbi:sulfite exporter TauE/SafE family protein [Sandaracinus amylolyticus]|uniref:Probable membrane transporter protein n=1 Tax=Sandaracinus amylolyticus TaxID=927083 RepID=A0A0F6YH07_9BACT|nr:sulfite exporter TauE/SafE family protein [Sandaracinus amylolyticus]AKF05297.1 Membrane protein, putative [Sandaracinus amylolyticus]